MKYVREHAPEILIIAGIAIFCVALGNMAMATEKPPTPNQTQSQQQANNQTQTQSANQSQGNSQTSNHRAWAFANGAPIPGNCPPGFLPGKGLKRAHSQLFGASAWSAVCQRDQAWWDEIIRQADHERRLDAERLQLERDRVKLETLRLELCTECGVKK